MKLPPMAFNVKPQQAYEHVAMSERDSVDETHDAQRSGSEDAVPRAFTERYRAHMAHCFHSHTSWYLGSGYVFGVYSAAMKKELRYTQEQVDLVGSVGEIGQFLGIFAGLFYSKFGPRATMITGGVMSALGFLALHLFISHQLASSLPTVCSASFVGLFGNAFRVTASTAVVVFYFPPEKRGQVVGLVKGSFAIGTSIFSQYFYSFFANNVSAFLAFMFAYTIAITIVTSVVLPSTSMKHVGTSAWPSLRCFRLLKAYYGLILFMALYLSTLSLVNVVHGLQEAWHAASSVFIMIFLAVIMFIPFVLHPNDCATVQQLITRSSAKQVQHEEQSSVVRCETLCAVESTIQEESKQEQTEKTKTNLRFYEMLRKPQFYALFFIFFWNTGSGMVVINNMPQILTSSTNKAIQTKLDKYMQLLICFLGIGNFVGRVFTGFLSDWYSTRAHICPEIFRSKILLLCSVGTCFSFLLLAVVHSPTLPVLFILFSCIGFFYGGTFAMVPSLTADLFGPKFFAENYGALDIAPALGSVVLATLVTNWFYADQFEEINTETGVERRAVDCAGDYCFRETFAIASVGCFVASIVAVLLSETFRRAAALKQKNDGLVQT